MSELLSTIRTQTEVKAICETRDELFKTLQALLDEFGEDFPIVITQHDGMFVIIHE